MNPIVEKIKEKTGLDLVHILSEKLSGTELNSLLLAVFDEKVRSATPASLLQQYVVNRFVQPAEGDPVQLRTNELSCLTLLKAQGFEPLDLSPVSLLGSCSIVGTVDQKKIISATRGTEVMADATNAMALHAAYLRKTTGEPSHPMKFCTTHRHVRTPPPAVKGFTAHFKIACWASAGKDTGSFAFEREALTDHLLALREVLTKVFATDLKYIKLQPRTGYPPEANLIPALVEAVEKNFIVKVDEHVAPNDYYRGVQFKAVIEAPHQGASGAPPEIEIADGGFVDWTQQMLGNRKERFLITGLGIEYLSKL